MKLSRRGATRAEILVVVILGLVVGGMCVAFLLRSRGQAAQVVCAENLRRIGVSLYERAEIKLKRAEADDDLIGNRSAPLPASCIAPGYATWAVQLSPFLQDRSPLARWDLALPFLQQGEEVRQAVIPYYFCPARNRPSLVFSHEENGKTISGAMGDYACASGDGDSNFDWTGPDANGSIIQGVILEGEPGGRITKWNSRTSLGQLRQQKGSPGRGLSYTILLGEKHVPLNKLGSLEAGDGSLYDGRHPDCYARVGGPGFALATHPEAPFNYNFGSYHPGFSHFLYADLQVQPASLDISPDVLGGLIRRGN